MSKLFHVIEIIILTFTIICMLFLVFIQITLPKDLLTIPVISKYNNDTKYMPISKLNVNEKGIVVIKLLNSNLENVEILINGDVVNNFRHSDEISIEVYNNDLIEIDGTKYIDRVKVKIVGISKNLELPKLDTVVETSQSIEMLGRVKLK